MRDKYTFNLRVITPLFMGGANHEPEIRTQSLNGVFRWWFRVAGGSRKDEERIFGSASDASGRRGLVDLILEKNNAYRGNIIKVKKLGEAENETFKASRIKGSGLRYLAFALRMGKRTGIKEGFDFRLKVSFHPLASEDDKKKFLAAMWLALNLGNFGARARRGFGSIGVESVVDEEGKVKENIFGLKFKVPTTPEDIDRWVKQNIKLVNEMLKQEITHQEKSPEFKIFTFVCSFGSYELAMNYIGKIYRDFRRGLEIKNRIFFGLPLVLHSKRIVPEIQVNSRQEKTRRASPMIFKILRVGNRYVGLVVVVVYEFLPSDAEIVELPADLPIDADINEYRKIVDLKKVIQKVIPNFEEGLNLRRIYP